MSMTVLSCQRKDPAWIESNDGLLGLSTPGFESKSSVAKLNLHLAQRMTSGLFTCDDGTVLPSFCVTMTLSHLALAH